MGREGQRGGRKRARTEDHENASTQKLRKGFSHRIPKPGPRVGEPKVFPIVLARFRALWIDGDGSIAIERRRTVAALRGRRFGHRAVAAVAYVHWCVPGDELGARFARPVCAIFIVSFLARPVPAWVTTAQVDSVDMPFEFFRMSPVRSRHFFADHLTNLFQHTLLGSFSLIE